MHLVRRSSDTVLAALELYSGHSTGYTSASVVDHTCGSAHTGLSLNALAVGGSIAPHVHAYEEGFYVLEGQVLVAIGDHAYVLGPGDFGAIKVGTEHSWRNAGAASARWLQMAAPQPKPAGRERDTFFAAHGRLPSEDDAEDVAAHARRKTPAALLGHFDTSQIPPPGETRVGAGVAPGVFLKWMIDEQLGARHHRMLFIEYQPGVSIALHDHTFEEAYFIVAGEVQATLDGQQYLVKAGDVVWTGVGCVHAFANVSSAPVQWLETFSPQPPQENVFRFMAEWEKRAREIEG